ncbi:methyltransferase domain-containing protein [Jannaschia sp. Os4]|nr:methyltransferase [Jannaschia sp. Os4]MBM2575528.1 methyltransferase domain-containing protein [Jannaschia sp. Os4]
MPALRRTGWVARLVASRSFQRWAAATPIVRRFARADGEALMDVVAGFVHSQILHAMIETRLLHRLMEGEADTGSLAVAAGLPRDRAEVLLRGAAALKLVREMRGGWRIARRGAALLGVPGLEAMVLHHRALYADLADPVALLRGDGETELSRFWPYVFGAARAEDPETARRYSDLMADSQVIVAEETLARVDLSDAEEVLDVGGGTGAFLAAVGAAHAGPRLHLFDLPAVVPGAAARFAAGGLEDRVSITPGSFRDAPLPVGADVVTLVRVLYDHGDSTVAALLRAAYEALPPGGRVVVSEPMGGARATDAYFALYTLAMRTGRTRNPRTIMGLLAEAGFDGIRDRGTTRPFVTRVVEARRPST